MPMRDHNCIWVKKSVVAEALGKASLKRKKAEVEGFDGEWSWTRARLVAGNLSGVGHCDSPVTILVTDESSEFDNQSIELPAALLAKSSQRLLMANEGPDDNIIPPDDLVTLTHLHEPAVVYCLWKRYEQDLIYTATGPILLALNPYKEIRGLYEDDTMGKYWAAGEKFDESLDLAPHVYGAADNAFRCMMRALESGLPGHDQSLLVSGESGAGKTVTTKHIMKYLATLSQRKAEHAKRRRAPSPGRGENSVPHRATAMSRSVSRMQSWKAGAQIEEKILESNPILEAFGNACTIRNDNSSRFGKCIELQFKLTGSLIGASVEAYLLEKVRLIHQGPGERNFHIFYEMLAAATDDEREIYMLNNYTVQDFKMTNSSGTYHRRDGVNDAELFDKLILAMSTMGFDPSTQEDIFSVSMAFLHASNLTFIAITDDSSKVDESNPHLEPVLKLLGLNKDAFQSALCEFEIEAGNTSYRRQLNAELAAKGLEALIKATYGAMFSFIVQSINKKIDCKPKPGEMQPAERAAYIGVLDIFGFESFQNNSFEQLCINYCNEALQRQFNLIVFESEQQEYIREGIAWEFVEFPDNQDVIDLIGKKGTGIISLLTDQCRTPRGSDNSFADAIYKACGNHTRFEASDLQRGSHQFIVHHYAGPVMYNTEGFLEKNKDEIPRGTTGLLESSRNGFVQLLGKICNTSGSVGSSFRAPQKRPTVGSQFASQLGDLRKRIDLTNPHYIRCLKPNQHLSPEAFDNSMIADQLRYAGVLEAIRVSRLGYSQRCSNSEFVQRYHCIASDAVQNASEDRKTEVLVDVIAKKIWLSENPNGTTPSDLCSVVGIQKGNTKVFLRQNAYDYIESIRSQLRNIAAVTIQSHARTYVVRKIYKRLYATVVTSQACARRFLARKYIKMVIAVKAARVIQKNYRMSLSRGEFHQLKAAIVWCQKMERGRADRKLCMALSTQKKAEAELANLKYRSAVEIQCMYRLKAARFLASVLRQEKVEMESAERKSVILEEGRATELEQERQKAAIAADRAAAVAKEVGLEKNKEVETLRKQLERATAESGQAQLTREEIVSLKAELEMVKAELEKSKLAAEKSMMRLAEAEAENKMLKQKIKVGTWDTTNGGYVSERFSDHLDLKQLDERIHGITLRSKQGKRDLEALVQALAILR